jgi:hypothetical protein
MVNSIKPSGGGDGLALQVTEAVRRAGLVEESPPENPSEDDSPPYPTYLAAVRVHAVENVLLVVDRDTDRVPEAAAAELVASAIRDTGTARDAGTARVQESGHGYQLQLPTARDAGFREGDRAPVQPAPGVLVVHRDDRNAVRLAKDLVEIRRSQVEAEMNH